MKAERVILDAIRQRSGMGVVLVALDGRSAAGKSTLATSLSDLADAAVVHVDDFYRDLPEAERLALTPEDGVDRYFDWERLRDDALTPLMEHKHARFRQFDWIAGGGLVGEVIVEPREVVIVEGVYSARPEFDDLLSLKVLVEAPDNERERRRRDRHDPHDWEERWDAAERHYFKAIRPRSAFDLVVVGDV
jgi:uridine kinase